MNLLIKWLVNALVLIGLAYYLPGIEVAGFYTALIVAVVLAVVNLLFKPIIVILTLPINIVTLGLFTFVINGFLFWFVGTFIEGFEIESFGWAIVGALVYSFFSYIGQKLLIDKDKNRD